MVGCAIGLGSDEYALDFDLSNGIRLANLRNLVTGKGYLRDQRYAGFGNPFTVELLGGNGCYQFLLAVTLRVEVPPQGPASYWHLGIENTTSEHLAGRIIWPRLAGLSVTADLLEHTA